MKPVLKSIGSMVGLFLAACALFGGDRANAQAGCSPDAATITCTGDQSGGIDFSNAPFSTLVVHSLSTDISAAGVPGIRFSTDSGGALALISDTRPYSIETNGGGADGLYVSSRLGQSGGINAFTLGDISVSAAGDITTGELGGRGISVRSDANLSPASQDISLRGGNVSLFSEASISTYAASADAVSVYASVGSRQGTGGHIAQAQGGDVSVVTTGTILTHGGSARGVNVSNYASGISSGKLGWGGKPSWVAITTGQLSVDNTGLIRTFGSGAHGVDASSTANAHADDDATAILGKLRIESKDIETFGAQARGIFAEYSSHVRTMELGVLRADGVAVTNSGLLSTHGNSSAGIHIAADAVIRALDNREARVTYGDITIDNTGSIVTRGNESSALFLSVNTEINTAQAIKATFGSITVNSRQVRSIGQRSHGIRISDINDLSSRYQSYDLFSIEFGARTVNSHDVLVSGDDAHGIYVSHSVSNDRSQQVQSADVEVNSTGTLAATGVNSVGILVGSQASAANATNGDISINVLGGSVTGGSGTGAGISIAHGRSNTITNLGEISALSGVAIRGGVGGEVIENQGAIAGDVVLGTGANAFNNHASGHFLAGTMVDLGAGNVFTNDGRLAPGGTGAAIATVLTGGLVQGASGVYEVDVDLGSGSSDRADVSESASLAGTVVARAIGSGAAGLSQQFHILRAAGGVTDDGIEAVDTAAVDYSVIFDANGQDVYLGAVIDFTTTGLNRNQAAIANGLNDMQAGGHDASMAPAMAALMNLPTSADLARAYDQLSPEVFAYQRTEALLAAADFSNALMSCREAGRPNAAIREGECLWARARATDLDNDRTTENLGFESRVGSFAAGLQVAMAQDWKLGIAAGYDFVSLSTASGTSSDGDRTNVGAVVKYNPDRLLLAAGVAAGWGTFETDRRMAFGGFAATASSKNRTDYVTGWLHAAYLVDAGNWYLKPLVDARITEIDFGGARDSGAAGLAVSGARDTVLSVSPAVEIGREFHFDSLAVWRPFLRAGMTWHNEDSFLTQASFAGALPGAPDFQIATDLDDMLFNISAGVDVIGTEGAVLRVQYDGSFGSTLSQNSFSLKGSVPF